MQALRLARRARGLAAIVTIILTLGIGLTTAMFTLLNGVLLEPLPYRDPSRLVRFHGVWPNSSRDRPAFDVPGVRNPSMVKTRAPGIVIRTSRHHFPTMFGGAITRAVYGRPVE